MRRLALVIAALSLVTAGVGAASPGLGRGGGVPPFPDLPGNWSHAEINVTIKQVPHTLILDRGRIMQVSPQSLVLHRRDGTNVTIQVSPATIYMPARFAVRPGLVRKGLYATTMIVDGGPAVRVRVTLRP